MLNSIIDWLQATFPPNRVVVLLGGVLTAVSGVIAAWLAIHFPGVKLGAPEVAGVMGAALLISIRLLDRWIDQWQRHEPIAVHHDLEQAINELADDPEVQAAFAAVGTLQAAGKSISDLRAEVESGNLDRSQLSAELGSVVDLIAQYVHDHPQMLEHVAPPTTAPAPAGE